MISNISDVIERLKGIEKINDKIAHDHFYEPQKLPFCCYVFSVKTRGADDLHSLKKIDMQVELYEDEIDYYLHDEVFAAFKDVELETDSDYINSERMYMTVFRFSFCQKQKINECS